MFPEMFTVLKAVIMESGRLNGTSGQAIHPSSVALNRSSIDLLEYIDGSGSGTFLEVDVASIDSCNRFFLAMLCISLIVGIIYCCYAGYTYWYKSRVFLSYVLAISISLLLRTFFDLLLLTVFIMGDSSDNHGCNTLIAFETFSMLMASSYWLILSVYLHESTESLFNSEPKMKFFHYGIPGVATFFVLVWMFILAGAYSDWFDLLLINPAYNWIIEILRLLYLCIQILLTINIGAMIIMKKSTFDTECVSLLSKCGLAFLGLVALFWIEFGFSVSHLPKFNQLTYMYFLYLVEGLQCAIACPLLFLLEKWGHEILGPRANATRIISASGHPMPPPLTQEKLIDNSYRRTISTIESVYGGQARDQLHTETLDVVYSNIVPPARLGRIFDLYKRLGILTSDATSDLTDDKFYECREDDAKTVYNDCISKASDNIESEEEPSDGGTETKAQNAAQKKNAFYSSKYLVVDTKNEFVKQQQTQPENESKTTKSETTIEN